MRVDVGCDDFVKAARNRRRVAKKENIEAYLRVEMALRRCPHDKPLPTWIPLGNVPLVGKDESKQLSNYGMHIINEGEINENNP